jgi:hypothetical protein
MSDGLGAFTAQGRFWRGNLHTHSTLSDGVLEPAEVCRRYADEGYDFICLSDHMVGRYGYPIADTTPFRSNSFTTVLGAEVHSDRMANGEIWHILAVGLPPDFERPDAPDFDGETAPEAAGALAARCAEAGAFVAIAHPEWNGMTPDDASRIGAAHAVEIYNHGCEVECERGYGTAILDQLLAGGRRLTACATDDAHFAGPDHFGGWVMVKAPELDPAALVRALRAGDYYSSQGPRLHDLRVEGDELVVECSPVERVVAVGARAAAAQRYGSGMRSARLPLARFRPGGWVRVTAVDRHGRRAWANPVWLE